MSEFLVFEPRSRRYSVLMCPRATSAWAAAQQAALHDVGATTAMRGPRPSLCSQLLPALQPPLDDRLQVSVKLSSACIALAYEVTRLIWSMIAISTRRNRGSPLRRALRLVPWLKNNTCGTSRAQNSPIITLFLQVNCGLAGVFK